MQHAAIVLIGGHSSRMGKNKALLPYYGKHLVDYVLDQLKLSGFTDCYLSGALPGYDCILDSTPHLGPLGGMQSTLHFLESKKYENLFFTPVDMPYLCSEVIQPLCTPLGKWDARCFLKDPLPLYVRTDALKKALAQKSVEETAVFQLFDYINVEFLSVSKDEKALSNVNTPAEWNAVCNGRIDEN